MFWARIIFVACLLGCTGLSAQDSSWIRCRIVDAKSKKSVPFASIQLKGKHVGVVSNFEGDFQIPSRYRDSRDTLLISCIGYTTRSVALSNVAEGDVFVITLTESATVLSPVVISGGKKHRLTPNKIIKAAIDNIAYNCSREPFTYQAYYRDYQIEDNAYVNLNEAIVQVEDSGIMTNDQLNTNIRLLQYRPNTEFKRDSTTAIAYDNTENKFIPNATIGNFGGNELMILRVHDPIRNNKNFSFSFIERLNRDFLKNHNFTFSDPVKRAEIRINSVDFGSN
ncbi:MAG TPA: carboxypeptidase-like regulatory domain-containing protein [Chryseolinea sp.]|nr:carboxypeptidase-like regulatory domain-containing protein [Chryseolinea sp.]